MRKFFRRYYVIEITPMKFHKFYHWVLTPINIVLTIYALISFMLDPAQADVITISYDLALLVCLALTFIGCFKMKKYAWIAIIFSFGLELIYDICCIAVFVPLGVQAVIYALSQVLWRIVFIILMAGYYIKRQPLFFDPVPYDQIPKELRDSLEKKGKG